jgi:hypothetical protein
LPLTAALSKPHHRISLLMSTIAPAPVHSPRQQPVATALDQLLAAAEATATAVMDNAFEDGRPVDPVAIRQWRERLDRIARALDNASNDSGMYYLPFHPSFSGKELL